MKKNKVIIAGIICIVVIACLVIPYKVEEYLTSYKLLESVELSNIEQCKEAIKSGANINHLFGAVGERTDTGTLERNPLRIASYLGSTDIVRLLLEKGADPNAIDAEGLPVFSYMVKEGNIDTCRLMIQCGADINLKSKKGITPLDCCFKQGDSGSIRFDRDYKIEQMYDFLIQNGAEFSINIMDYAMEGTYGEGYCRYTLIQKLAKQLDQANEDIDLNPVLKALVLQDYKEAISLIQQNKNLDSKVLFFAAAFGNKEILDLLISKGMDINSKDELGNSLLTIASKTGNLETMKYLIPQFKINGKDGYNALVAASDNNQLEAARLLLNRGAKISMNKDEYYDDMLALACNNGNVELAKLFIENGYPKEGYSGALHEACSNNQLDCVRLLYNNGVDVNELFNESSPMTEAIYGRNLDCVKLLFELGAKVNTKELSTPLGTACYIGNIEIVKYLISKGAMVNLHQTKENWKEPIMNAINSGSLDIIKLLVKNGATIGDDVLEYSKVAGSDNIYHYLQSITEQ